MESASTNHCANGTTLLFEQITYNFNLYDSSSILHNGPKPRNHFRVFSSKNAQLHQKCHFDKNVRMQKWPNKHHGLSSIWTVQFSTTCRKIWLFHGGGRSLETVGTGTTTKICLNIIHLFRVKYKISCMFLRQRNRHFIF